MPRPHILPWFLCSLATLVPFTSHGAINASQTLVLQTGGIERARITAQGVSITANISAANFIGNGAGLTNITSANADTVDGLHANQLVAKAGDTMTGNLTVPYLYINPNGAEGGEFQLVKGSGQGNLAGNVVVDTANDMVRIYENGGGYRQFNFNLVNGLLSGPAGSFWHTGNDGSGSGLDAGPAGRQQLHKLRPQGCLQ